MVTVDVSKVLIELNNCEPTVVPDSWINTLPVNGFNPILAISTLMYVLSFLLMMAGLATVLALIISPSIVSGATLFGDPGVPKESLLAFQLFTVLGWSKRIFSNENPSGAISVQPY